MRFGKHVSILHVEDDAVDVAGLRRAFRSLGIRNRVVAASGGEAALELLHGELDPGATIALLDLNMPRMTGVEFLARVRATPRLRDLVVYVLTTSDLESDIAAAYRHGVAGYIVKPPEADALRAIVARLHGLWRASRYLCGVMACPAGAQGSVSGRMPRRFDSND